MKFLWHLIAVVILFLSEVAFAQRELPTQSRSTPSFIIGFGYGLSYLSSPGLTNINDQLGNSALMTPSGVHGLASNANISILKSDKEFNKFYTFSATSLSDSVTASGAGNSVTSKYSLWSFGGGIGVRLHPFVRQGFNPSQARDPKRTRIRMKEKLASFFKKFYILGLANAELASISHSYAMSVPSTRTIVDYSQSGTHLVMAPTVRIGYFAGSLLHFFVDTSYEKSTRLGYSVKINNLIVQNQDQRYRAASVGIGTLASEPFWMARIVGGISFQF